MIRNIIEFAVLAYYPSSATKENINVGILFNIVSRNERLFHIANNWKRIESFDDELDMDFLKACLMGIKAEVESDLFNLGSPFDMEEYIRYYVNELRFDAVCVSETDNVEEFIELTTRVCMRLDYEKKDRIDRGSEVKYLKSLLRKGNTVYQVKPVVGIYSENVNYDFVVGKYGFKVFSFANKDLRRIINDIKAWAFTANSLNNSYETIFVYDDCSSKYNESKELNVIKEILGQNGKLLTASQAVAFISAMNEKTANNEEQLQLI